MENKENKEKSFYTNEEVDKVKLEANDKYLRLAAEFDNYKRRVQKEKDDLRTNTKTMMLTAILDLDSTFLLQLNLVKIKMVLN